MKRLLLCWLVLGLSVVSSLRADETVRTVQNRLKAGGFYSGEVNGVYDSDTAAALTRYQIRNGLQITGKLDSQTRNALGVAAGEPQAPIPRLGEDVWRYLRASDREYIRRLMAEEAVSASPSESATPSISAPAPAVSSNRTTATAKKTRTQRPAPATSGTLPAKYDRDHLRDYIAAFVLAGLDPQVGSETEFFADQVNYFGEPRVSRERIRRDLQRYDNRWPERRFWLAGELEVAPINDQLKVSFPLHYELRSGSRRSSGKVWKTLILQRASNNDLQIVSVNERKLR